LSVSADQAIAWEGRRRRRRATQTRNGGLADAALARGHGDDVLDARDV